MTQRKSTRIIIADDEAVIRMGLQTMVSSLGYLVVDTAANGYDALEKTRRLKPDLLILDIKMPGKDGIAVAETLAKEMPLPIIMLTAYTERALIQRAVNASVMGYLVKPITEIKLGPTIELALERFAHMSAAAKQAYKLRDQLEARELVEAAKKILIETGLTESEAYQRLQMAAREKRRSMRQVAEAVIAVGERLVA